MKRGISILLAFLCLFLLFVPSAKSKENAGGEGVGGRVEERRKVAASSRPLMKIGKREQSGQEIVCVLTVELFN